MNFKANYEIVPLSSGANTITGGTIHQVYCIATGAATIIAEGGGEATFSMTANDYVNVLTKSINVGGGTFVGFRAKQ